MKKIISLVLCIMLMATLLMACSSKDSSNEIPKDEPKQETAKEDSKQEEAKSGEQVTIDWFMETMDDESKANFEKYIINPLAEKLPHIKVNYQPTADWNQVLKVQMAAGQGPDFFALDGPTVASEYAASGRILDLTPYVGKYGWDKIIFPWALDSCKIAGTIYSIPNSYEALVLWYNEDMFKENGWEMPKTFGQLEKIAKEGQSKGIIPFAFGTSNFKPANEWFISIALANYAGGDAVKKALLGEAKWTDEPIKGSIAILDKMWKDGWLNDRNAHSISLDDSYALFSQKKTSMKMEGTWLYSTFLEQKPDFKWNVGIFPSLKDGTPQTLPLAIGGVWAVNSDTKYPDECAEIINFMYTTPERYAKHVEEAGAQTLPMDIPANLFTDAMSPIQKSMIQMLSDAQKSGDVGYCMWTFWPPETRNFMIENIEKVFMDKMSIDKYLSGTQEVFDKEKAAGKVPIIP
jgi:raffinose/stachyose/melibiose transport system substrate-binding protein